MINDVDVLVWNISLFLSSSDWKMIGRWRWWMTGHDELMDGGVSWVSRLAKFLSRRKNLPVVHTVLVCSPCTSWIINAESSE